MQQETRPVELALASALLAVTTMLSVSFHLPLMFPGSGSASFVGIHYLLPLLGAVLLAVTALINERMKGYGQLAHALILGVPSFAIVLLCHFNLKLWVPHINPYRWDDLLWASDQRLHWLVEICMWIRRILAPVIPYSANFYMLAFIMQFYLTFAYYAIKQPQHFRELLIAVMLMQTIGAMGYMAMPAIGPFLFEPGNSPLAAESQAFMLDVYRHSVAGGPDWLREHGSAAFAAGLGAMPSLHVAGALLFFIFGIRHARLLLPFHVFCLGFIVVTAVANRWHYLLDLPAGAAVAWASLAIAARLARHGTAPSDAPGDAKPQPLVRGPHKPAVAKPGLRKIRALD